MHEIRYPTASSDLATHCRPVHSPSDRKAHCYLVAVTREFLNDILNKGDELVDVGSLSRLDMQTLSYNLANRLANLDDRSRLLLLRLLLLSRLLILGLALLPLLSFQVRSARLRVR